MSFRPVRTALLHFLGLLLIFATGAHLYAQAPSGGLSGVVTDPSGGVIAKATVRLVTSSGRSLDATTNRDGFYEFKGLARYVHAEGGSQRLHSFHKRRRPDP